MAHLIVSRFGVDKHQQRAGPGGSCGLPVTVRVYVVDGGRGEDGQFTLAQRAD